MIKKKIFKMAQILAEECEECGFNCKIIIEGEEDNYTLNVKGKGSDKSKKKNKNEDSLGGIIINH